MLAFRSGIRLGDGEQATECLAQDSFGGGRLGRPLRSRCGGTRLRHGLEGAALVRCVALDRLDEVRDQVAAPLELHLDLGP